MSNEINFVTATYYNSKTHKAVPKDAIVLDLSEAPYGHDVKNWVHNLRSKGGTIARNWVADQIEAQIKPPRIPEPGLWGVVEADWKSPGITGIPRAEWVRVKGNRWRSAISAVEVPWSELVNPELIRPGV